MAVGYFPQPRFGASGGSSQPLGAALDSSGLPQRLGTEELFVSETS
jgi:hypothetical protein